MKTKLEQALESGTIQFPRGLTGEERRAFIKEKLMKTIKETRRELFEAWARKRDFALSRLPDGYYSNAITDWSWSAFNAALDAVEIELPEKEYSCEYGFHYFDAGNTIDAIESLNLGIKIK